MQPTMSEFKVRCITHGSSFVIIQQQQIPMVVGSEVGPCPNLFDAERVTLMSFDGRQDEDAISNEFLHMVSRQAGLLKLTLE